MKLLLVFIAVLILEISMTSGYSLSKIELKNPSDVSDIVYKVQEDKNSNTITIVNPKPEKPTLREIINYNIMEKALGSNEELPEGPDFDDSRRPFTNGHGYQYLALEPDDDSEEVITEVALEESTTQVSETTFEKRTKRVAKFPGSEDYSYEDDSSVGHDFGSNSDENKVLGYPRDEDITNNYGMKLNKDGGYVWNNLLRPKLKYNVYNGHNVPYSGADSESEESSNSASEDFSGQSEDPLYSNKYSEASESDSQESGSKSNEDYAQWVKYLNEEPNGGVYLESFEDISQESNEDLDSSNEEAKIESQVSSEFDDILNYVFPEDDSSLPETEKRHKVNDLLHDIFNSIVKNVTNEPAVIFESKVDGKSNILKILHGIFTNIIKNDITITNNIVSSEPNLEADRDKVDNKSPDATENPVTNDTESPFTPELSYTTEVPSNVNTEWTTGEYTTLTGYETENPIEITEKPETEVLNEVTTEPTTNVNIESKPMHDAHDANKLDHMAALMNNEKFWTFMGDLAGKYLEELMARTGLHIKQEIESQLKDHLENQKKEGIPNEDKEVTNDLSHNDNNTLNNDKMTNVYVYYLNNNSENVIENVKKIVNSNNGTNIFTFGIDNTKDGSKETGNGVSDVTDAPGTDFDLPIEPSTILIEDTSPSYFNSELSTGLDETTTNDITTVTAVSSDVTNPNNVGLIEEKDHVKPTVTTENEFETEVTESPETTVVYTVSDINTSTKITGSATINNDITEVPPVTENNEITSTAENEITVTVSDSSDVTTQSETVTTPADDTQVNISVPVTESTTNPSENELTTQNYTAYTDSETIVTDLPEKLQTSTLNSEIITDTTVNIEVTTENHISITEISEGISTTESETLTTVNSEIDEVTTDSSIATENISIIDENTVITTETPSDIETTSENNDEAVVTTAPPDDSNNGDVTGNDDVTKLSSVPDKVATSFDNNESNTEQPNSNENKDSDVGNNDGHISATTDNTSYG